jgi:hypothetical protein
MARHASLSGCRLSKPSGRTDDTLSPLVWVLVAVVVVGALTALFGWDRYRSSKKTAGGSFQSTGEVFTDPASGKRMRVWHTSATGEREYRPDSHTAPTDLE